jgi:hypothetical protein
LPASRQTRRESISPRSPQVVEHVVDQRRLADAGLAGDEHDLAPPTRRRLERLGNLHVFATRREKVWTWCTNGVCKPNGTARRRNGYRAFALNSFSSFFFTSSVS